MNDKLRVKFAEFEGYADIRKTSNRWVGYKKPSQRFRCGVPTYDNHTDLFRLIGLMDDDVAFDYATELDEIVKRGEVMTIGSFLHTVRVCRPTIPQLQEAIARAIGAWEEE